MIDYSVFLDQILDGYKSGFDIERIDNPDGYLVAKAHMHVIESQCMIFEELKMWTADADEYVYIYHIPHLTDSVCEQVINEVYADGMPLIDLDHVSLRKQHMCTNLVALFICDTADDTAVKRIKKCRIYKSFQFSLKGWMEMHTALITLPDQQVYSNRYGKDTAKFLKMHLEHYNKLHM